ncbi:hypothetical protein VTJ83DRAFT_1007 [Remersonia thermophila]|uniref:BZIP domain-containing protein n=1 Tax=Remersonia thermophila TaxID=72144 RepID=A0ABR4DMS0_9PEZI
MSQGDSAPHHIPPQSAQSPARAADVGSARPAQQSHGQHDDTGPQHPRDMSGFPLAEQPPEGAKAPIARGILHPPELGGSFPEPPFIPHSSPIGGLSQPAMVACLYSTGSPRPLVPQSASSFSRPRSTTQPALPTKTPVGLPPDHGSPQPAHPPHSIAARRILTPKSPRAAGPSRAAMRSLEAAQHSANLQGITGLRGRALTHDSQTYGPGPSPLGASPQLYSSASSERPAAQSPTRPMSSLSRSLSQPSLAQDFKPAPIEPIPPVGTKRDHGGRSVLSGPPFPASFPTAQPLGTPGGWPEARRTPVTGSVSASVVRSLSLSEGQPVLAITPQHGEEILVPVDVHQGSRQADQKRQRNAGASARFRQRKKEREREQQEEMQKLDAENKELTRRNEELAKRCQELESHRDFYRHERNRLRDALYRFPGGQEWAERGPRSPVMTTTMPEPLPPDSNAQQFHQPPAPSLLPPPTPAAPHPHSESSHPHFQQQQGQQQQQQQQQQHAPPFPTPSRPVTAPRQPQHIRTVSYNDVSTLEPSARRRRTDSEPQLPSSYRLGSQQKQQHTTPAPTPLSLPPLSHAISGPSPGLSPGSFGVPPSPHVTPPPVPSLTPPATAPPGPPGAACLPPLRFDHPLHQHHPGPGTGPGQQASITTPTATPPPLLAAPLGPPQPRPSSTGSPYMTAATTRPVPYETGWATVTRPEDVAATTLTSKSGGGGGNGGHP